MKRLLCAALASLILSVSGSAAVLVYRGAYDAYAASLPPTEARSQKCFVVVGDAPSEDGSFDMVILHYGQRNGTKTLVTEFKRNVFSKDFSSSNEKDYTAFALAESENLLLEFRWTAIFLRGENRTLTVSNVPLVTRTLPKNLGGVFRESIFSTLGGDRYAEGNLTVKLDSARTVAVNNASKSFDATVIDLKAELNAAGYGNP